MNRASELTKPKVLIVDEDEDFAFGLKAKLVHKGYEVTIAHNSKQALDLIMKNGYDLGLIDLSLASGSGLDLIHRYKMHSPETELVVTTDKQTLPVVVKALNAGAFGYLEKPYNIDRLFILFERALEHQKRLRTIKESEARYRRLYEELNVAMCILNLRTGQIFKPNKAFSKLFGYDETERLSFKDLFFKEDYPKLDSEIKRVCLKGRASFETRLHRKGNTDCWAEIHFTLLDTKTDSLCVTLIIDLTKRKQVEADLSKTKGYLEAIFSEISAGVCIIDLNHTILDANPAFSKLVGLARAFVVGRKCYELLNNRNTSCFNLGEICPIQNCRVSLSRSRCYHEYWAKDGKRRVFEVSVTPLKDEKGNLSSFISVLNDLTEIQNAKEELEKANSELQRLSQAKSEFVSIVSHELRTPLEAILEGVSLIEDGSLGPINSDQQRFLTLTKNNAKRLTELINNLLDLQKIEAGRYDIFPRALDLKRIIHESAQTLEHLLKEKGIKLNLELTQKLPPVLADEHSIFRVMINLLSNAIKFTPPGGIITISANFRIRPTESQGKIKDVVVSVTDTGVGIPSDQRQKLFKPFSPIVKTAQGFKNPPKGTGLGLALCKQLIELNQGEIWFQSEEGKGSKFSFSLPVFHFRNESIIQKSAGKFSQFRPKEGNFEKI